MSRKHFRAIADALRSTKPKIEDFGSAYENEFDCQLGQWKSDVLAIADCCGQFNGNFRRDTFLEACGL